MDWVLFFGIQMLLLLLLLSVFVPMSISTFREHARAQRRLCKVRELALPLKVKTRS